MSLPEYIPLADAARKLGVTRKTLRRWLQVEAGIVFAPAPRGTKRLVKVTDVEMVLRVHAGRPDWPLLRMQKAARA
jgi:predicted site-specific integrase-resolvase